MPAATEEESGLRARPRASFRDRQDELRNGLPDLSDQVVELPDEADTLDDVGASHTWIDRRSDAASPPPPLPVAAARGMADDEPPPLPLPLTRRSGLPHRATPGPLLDDARVDMEAVARLAAPSPAFDDAYAPPRARRPGRHAIVLAGAGILIGVAGFVATRLALGGDDEVIVVPLHAAATSADEPASDVMVLGEIDTRAEAPVQLDEVVVDTTARVRRPREIQRPRARDIEGEHATGTMSPEHAETAGGTSIEAAAPETGDVSPELPVTPSREDVIAALGALDADVRACAEGHFGVVHARVTVAGSGRVTIAQVTGGTVLGTPAGSCIARTLRRARFPAFTQPRFVVDYPFQL